MNKAIDVQALFAAHAGFLKGYGYRLTGSLDDAEDLVQETFVRTLERPPADTDRPWRPWLVRVATNLFRDNWRRQRHYIGPWLPMPIETDDSSAVSWLVAGLDLADACARYEARESVTFAFLLALEALSAQQRAVLLLRDVYDYSVRETAAALELSDSNIKTIHHRARRAMASYDAGRELPAGEERNQRALERLVRCFATGDVKAMEALLAADVKSLSDGNGVFYAAKVPVIGRQKVALLYSRITPRPAEVLRFAMRSINGLPALIGERRAAPPGFAPRWLLRVEIDADDLVKEIHMLLAPAKLARLRF